MASISLTYTLTNGTTADASQVMQNYNDIINGTSDGTKDFSINAITCAGTATFNGDINLGNAAADTITWTGSLGSSIPIKTTNTYDIGAATLGLRALYFGANGQTTKIVGSASMAASWMLTTPPNVPTVTNSVLASDTSGVTSWAEPMLDSTSDLTNYTLTATVGSSAMTIALKTKGGSDPSAAGPVYMAFRNATSATGDYTVVKSTAATSVVVSSGSTLGHTSAVATYFYVYAINNAGSIELAVGTKLFDQGTVQTSTTEGGAGAADSATVLYSTTGRSSKAIRLLARLLSTQVTAGTWSAVPTEISLGDGFITCAKQGEVNGVATLAGLVGETQTQSRLYASAAAVTSGTPLNVTASPLSLTSGIWMIRGSVYMEISSAQVNLFYAAISKNNSATIPSSSWGAPTNDEYVNNTRPQGTSGTVYMITSTSVIPPYLVTLTGSATFYLCAQASWATGAGVTVNGFIEASRIA